MLRPRWAGGIPRVRSAQPTYREVGASKFDQLPKGYHHIRRRVRLGNGRDVFDRAARQVRLWAMHFGARIAVHPAKPATTGLRVITSVPFGPFVVHGPCMVVWDVNDDWYAGFGYGTLAGHPMTGEEAFLVEIDESGEVSFTVSAFARPHTWYAKAAWPIAAFMQSRIIGKYLQGVVDATRR
ncbi:DUF1990 domain-containing protein [Pseudonocardiaceae bacterium YIM PH 21723]|nr:DUF1990 domain-containing protein [Pseudonocardiaceae bacterium YIM PH 21723]